MTETTSTETRTGGAADLASYTDRIAQAIGDPGSFLPRGDNYTESIPRWGTRAVLLVLADFADAVRAEERARHVAETRLDEFGDWTGLADLFGAELVTEGFPSGEYVTNMVWPDGRYACEADTLAILRSDGAS